MGMSKEGSLHAAAVVCMAMAGFAGASRAVVQMGEQLTFGARAGREPWPTTRSSQWIPENAGAGECGQGDVSLLWR